ncbi:hypothetical protein CBS101457_003744 [Exobasidium rhododendri]|nr:hypothetical protein CBS101457_003744 [Exobasidium rhododendri]
MSSYTTSPHFFALHQHLTNALLRPVCPDIKLKAFNRIYSLHRVFLVQSAFFNSLLNGEFKEARDKKGVWKRGEDMQASSSSLRKAEGVEEQQDAENAVEIYFDDPNITRPSFEFCLATLYGAAPELILPSWSCPSPEYPLTSHILPDSSNDSIKSPTFSSTSQADRPIVDQHPATPRFLLSLIATATYLEIPSVCSQAFTLILCSITPYTVSQYLRFSLGLGILGAQEAKDRQEGQHSLWDWELEGPVWGLEDLSRQSTTTPHSYASLLERTGGLSMQDDDDEEEEEGKAGSDRSQSSSPSRNGGKESRAESFLPPLLSERESVLSHQGKFYYGAPSDKIGEACSCWLLRWGPDVLLAEEKMQPDEDCQEKVSYISNFTLPREVLPVLHSNTLDETTCGVASVLSAPPPTVWCHPKLGGIPANWVRTIISSDSFWIRCEWDRYDIARRVIAMRRGNADDFVEADESVDGAARDNSDDLGDKLDRKASRTPSIMESKASGEDSENEKDEEEYATLFSEGIYYTHMTFEELSAISSQVCQSTNSTYVPMTVLQSALWAQSELKGMIMSQEKGKRESFKDVSTSEEEQEDVSSKGHLKKASDLNIHQERELGLISHEAEFADAYQSLQRKGRATRSNMSTSDYVTATKSSVSTVLGGMRPLMLLGGASKTSALENLLDKRFFAVPSDDTVRIGENLSGLINNGSAEAGSAVNRSAKGSEERGGPSGIAAVVDQHTLQIAKESKRTSSGDYFGIQNAVKCGRILGEEYGKTPVNPTSNERTNQWTGYEPMRLGVEFFNVDRLKEKERMYSPSFFYAGSIWNLYLQIIKKPKGLQLGIYLHRQNCNDSLPNPSFPSDLMTEVLNGDDPQTPRRRELNGSIFYNSSSPAATTNNHSNQIAGDGTSTPVPNRQQQQQQAAQQTASNIRMRSTLSLHDQQQQQAQQRAGVGISPTSSPNSNCIVSSNQQAQYHDQRRILRAYFSVHCPSPLGTSLTKFSSRPDNFSLSQSWGWKSSSLLGAVYLAENKIGSAVNEVSPIFRCIVTVGVV